MNIIEVKNLTKEFNGRTREYGSSARALLKKNPRLRGFFTD